jgi:L-threonylcarbamoyladenylate synthase
LKTVVLELDPRAPDASILARAAEILRRGGLVAFPTETVYGVGAHALDREAVDRIFAAKGRPATNPLIVHVADESAARALARAWPDAAARLAQKFWPGPLTLVVAKTDAVPDVVTAGGATVALRVPAHPVALALLREAGMPLAAPSANLSTRLSPTRAEHVLRGLEGRIDMLLDAGPTPGGIESTVLDVTTSPPRVLRPGLVTPGDIEAIVGAVQVAQSAKIEASQPQRSPGQSGKHYAPRTPLECPADSAARVAELLAAGRRVGWLTFSRPQAPADKNLVCEALPSNPVAYAARLYDALHRLDTQDLDYIIVTRPPPEAEWLAIHDRLRRAAGLD